MNMLYHGTGGDIAWNGTAEFRVLPTYPGKEVEVWERVVDFGNPAPNFQLFWTGPTGENLTRSGIPPGGLYQVLLYDQGFGKPEGIGRIDGALDYPSISGSGAISERGGIISRCQQKLQVELDPGGTFVTASLATCPPCMTRVQLSAYPPELPKDFGVGIFSTVAANAVSLTPNSMHRLNVLGGLLPGHEYFFTMLVWDSQGHWEYVSTTNPPGPPETVTLKRRRVHVALERLYIVDDSDDLSPGDASFSLNVQEKYPDVTSKHFGAVADSKKPVSIPRKMRVDIGPKAYTDFGDYYVDFWVSAEEDDTGSIPEDSNDHARTEGYTIEFPSGPAEEVQHEVVSQQSEQSGTGDGNHFIFVADVGYSVHYEF